MINSGIIISANPATSTATTPVAVYVLAIKEPNQTAESSREAGTAETYELT